MPTLTAEGVQTRRVILPSSYAGSGIMDGLPGETVASAISDFLAACTFDLGDNDDGEAIGRPIVPEIGMTLRGELDRALPPECERLDDLWQFNVELGSIRESAGFGVGGLSPVRSFDVSTPDAVALVQLFNAIVTGQMFNECPVCGATFARSTRKAQRFCSEKCRARQNDINRRERKGVLGKPIGRPAKA